MSNEVARVFDEWAHAGRGEGMERGHGYAVHTYLQDISLPAPFSFLDFGCGNGWLIRKMAQRKDCRQAIGFDGSAAMIERAQTQRKSSKEEYHCGSLADWQPPELLDLIFSMEALYYSVPMEPVLQRLVGFLRPGGRLIVGVDYYRENRESHSWPTDLGLPMDLRSRAEWQELFVSAGLQEVRQKQVVYPETEEMRWAREVHGSQSKLTWKQIHGTLFTDGIRG